MTAEGGQMRPSEAVRRFHRGLSVAFTLALLSYVIIASLGHESEWLGLVVLLPLVLLLATGLYLFVLPYARRRPGPGPG